VSDPRETPGRDEAGEMLAPSPPADRHASNVLVGFEDVLGSAQAAFALLCDVEKWPVWLSFTKTARRLEPAEPLGLGSEIAIRSAIPGEPEEVYEIDHFLPGHVLSLVGAYSLRRRLDFRLETKSDRSRLSVRLDYPAYGGVLGVLLDRLTVRRRLEQRLAESLVHFKGLVEFAGAEKDELLADF
jgi:hypothetical protein